MERSLAQYWQEQQTKVEEEVTETDLRRYYQDHVQEYDYPARARWEQISIYFNRVPDRAEAFQAIGELGNRFLVQGVPFSQVAREASHDPAARNGGFHDWTTEGSLVSTELDRHIFALPVGAPSQIIEDAMGYHIIRVVEREEAGRRSFEEMQTKIRSQIISNRRRQAQEKYLARLREYTPVSTIFDPEENSQGLSQRTSASASQF
jgi:parvulin-like peptidyl-prolyl isomerase